MNIREMILQELAKLVEEFSPLPFPDTVSDQTRLDEFWLDSIAFMMLITNLEEKVGIIPSTITKGEFQPKTVGDFVAMYVEELAVGV